MTFIPYYDKDGIPVTQEQWGLLWGDDAYRMVARSTVASAADLNQTYDVSTIWLGINHGFGEGLPLIFETMVFGSGDIESDCQRYSTLREAQEGHIEMVTEVASTMDDPIVMDVK